MQRDAFIKGHKDCIAETLKEKGCISYESHTSINDPNSYVVVERWETRDDLNAHGTAPHMKVWREYSARVPLTRSSADQVRSEVISDRPRVRDVALRYASRAHDPRDPGSRAASLEAKRRPTPSCSISTTGTGGGWR